MFRRTVAERAQALARLGRPDSALVPVLGPVPFDRNYSAELRDEIWRLATRRFALDGNLTAARHASAQITSPYNRTDALLAVARAELRAGHPAGARLALFKVPSLIQNLRDEPRALAYTGYLLAKSEDMPAARRVFKAFLAAMPPANYDEMPGESYLSNDDPLLTYWNCRFKAGLGRESLDQLPQHGWIRANVLAVVLDSGDFQLGKDIVLRTKEPGSRSELVGQFGEGAFKAGRSDLLRDSIQMARAVAVEIEKIPRPGPNDIPLPDNRFSAWTRVAGLQAFQGPPADPAVLDKICDLIPSMSWSNRMLMFHKEQPTRSDVINGMWLSLSQKDRFSYFPPDRRRQIAEGAFEAIKSLPTDVKSDRFLALAETVHACPCGLPVGPILAAAADSARARAQELRRAIGLYDLILTARTYRELGDSDTAAALASEILAYQGPERPRREILYWMAANGIWGPLLGEIQSNPVGGLPGPMDKAIVWQSSTTPAPPPSWILNLHEDHNRIKALSAWTEGLTKPRDAKLAKEEEEFNLTSYNYVD